MKNVVEPPSLFELAERAKQSAISRVHASHSEWVEMAVGKIRSVAQRAPILTSDEVWMLISEHPNEPRAMGAAFAEARKQKIIAPTQDWRQSMRVACHRRPLRVWKSLVHKAMT